MEIERNNGSDQVELRSEKVRNIIGTIPPALVRWGIAVITIIFVILMLVFLGVPYPYGKGESIFQHLFFS
ncbi:hypothetical protein DW785_04335 [Bacteroides xylanisolvens]|jgi:hypothetical protein|uniref:Uncharacterized protein n=2 Tax=Bacteroidaceae TaxID=815 RepID=A0A414HNT7_BACT4|nr:hypothetical protein BUN20_02330 [Bacteroides fragilis]RGJ00131.1 hypothetical protein DXD78_15525 [Bacteroides sp. D20]RGJ37430.1 hypothetical protein DXD65_02525 [Bacteroides sp. 4_1_36]RHD69709.1 hypothetical protein DW785_04335 [Bacteroides xylanisolvens]RHD83107.1 hypothetical protein DW783_04715 [Phocaeicola vulgatus]RHD88641.1 hypothetical protein DW780_10725 [Bacteroides thetaiotaomicron]RJU56451.1 hypothetical protein DW777_05325 [Bacteroides sp. AM30-16]DAV56405.1 MAG TPA: chiti